MKQHRLTLNDEQLAVLNAALVELPYRMAAPLINSINQQLMAQHERTPPQVEEDEQE